MSALRQRLSQPGFWLAFFFSILVLIVADSFRAPQKQWCVPAYVMLVKGYRMGVRPLLAGRVKCRFTPSCSEYSIRAVRRFGIRRGLVLTQDRIDRCRAGVPFATPDPVPRS